jgi:hypothetical protein
MKQTLMNTNLFSAIATVPVLAGGIVLNAGLANAASLTGELQLTGALVLPNPTTILFTPDDPDTGGDNFPDPAPVGESALVTIPLQNNSGSFVPYNVPNVPPTASYTALMRSIDVALGLPVSDFVLLPAVSDPTGTIAATSITLEDFSTTDLGVEDGFQEFSFQGIGFAINEGDISEVTFDFTAQGDVSNTGGVATPDTLYSFSGTIVATHGVVPEASNVVALLGLGLLGAGLLRNRKQNQVDSL